MALILGEGQGRELVSIVRGRQELMQQISSDDRIPLFGNIINLYILKNSISNELFFSFLFVRPLLMVEKY